MPANTQTMTCMEIWGGNALVDSGVVMAGLDAWVYSRPYKEAAGGGDVYYVSSCATGRINRLLVADVSGHGDDVADLAIDLRTLMRRYVNFIDQTRFVIQMNHKFVELAKEGLFATALVTTFFAPTNELSVCNAGHPPPLIYRAASRTWSYLEPSEVQDTGANIPLGILDLEDYAQFDVTLNVNDLVLCFTDSLIESWDPTGEILGPGGLLRLVQSIGVKDPARVVPNLLEKIAGEHPENLKNDDVTTLLFRPNGMSPHAAIKDRLLAPFRVIRGALASLFNKSPMPLPELSLRNIGGSMFGVFDRFKQSKSRTR